MIPKHLFSSLCKTNKLQESLAYIMEFAGVGTISYEPPPEHLKPFFRKKYKTFFRYLSQQLVISRTSAIV